jgi:hypothetical protein
MWAKKYILQYQCHYRYTHNSPHHLIQQKNYREPTCPDLFKSYSTPTNTTKILLQTLLGTTHEAKEIPEHLLNERYEEERNQQNLENFISPFLTSSSSSSGEGLISHVYYTESDQLLQIESSSLRNSILRSLNQSVHLIGRRREKLGESNPLTPLQQMYSTRHVCGNINDLYVLDTADEDHFIRRTIPT